MFIHLEIWIYKLLICKQKNWAQIFPFFSLPYVTIKLLMVLCDWYPRFEAAYKLYNIDTQRISSLGRF